VGDAELVAVSRRSRAAAEAFLAELIDLARAALPKVWQTAHGLKTAVRGTGRGERLRTGGVGISQVRNIVVPGNGRPTEEVVPMGSEEISVLGSASGDVEASKH